MADWPDLALLKQALGIALTQESKDDLLEQSLGSSIEGVVLDCGGSAVDVTFNAGVPTVDLADPSAEEPVEIIVTTKLSRAALHRAVTVYKGPDAPFGVAGIFDSGGIYVSRNDPIYQWLIKGNRVRFGVA
jgi:hypothetical protein